MEWVTDLSLWQILYTARKKEPQSLLIESSETVRSPTKYSITCREAFRDIMKGKSHSLSIAHQVCIFKTVQLLFVKVDLS